MSSELFHHPDFSWPVFRRNAEATLTDAFACYGAFLLTRGHSAWRQHSYPSRTAYWNAVGRLRKQGIVAYRRRGGRDPVLRVTPSHPRDLAVQDPRPFWKTPWRGYWHMLVYDVPEKNRSYRAHLRHILLQNRCGCLQGSVWISTRDLRPLFADLDQAAALSSMAHLLEARTVLGHNPLDLVMNAWDFDLLARLHARYLEDLARAHHDLEQPGLTPDRLAAHALAELAAYRTLIELDPLLPAALHPPGYAGPQVHARHERFVRSVQTIAPTLKH